MKFSQKAFASIFGLGVVIGLYLFLYRPDDGGSKPITTVPSSVKKSDGGLVWMFDIEKISKGEIIAAAAIQGLANRNGPRVFLRQTDRFWPLSYSYYKNYREKIDAAVLAQFPSPDHYWIDYYTRTQGYEFRQVADLKELVERNADVIKGAVRTGAGDSNAEAVAATIAGIHDLVPVSDEAVKSCPALATLPVMIDLRERFPSNATAEVKLKSLEWAIEEFLPKTSKSNLLSYFPSQFGYLTFDLAISRRMFCYNLSHLNPKATDEESRKFLANPWTTSGLSHEQENRLLNRVFEHLEPYSMVWGWDAQSENAIATRVAKNGSAATCCVASNLSFHASVPADNAMMPRQRKLEPDAVKLEDKYYIAFVSGAGDAAHTATSLMCTGRWLYSSRGKVPMNWTVSPYLVKTAPALMESYYKQRTSNDYFVNETSGYGYNHPSHIDAAYLMGYAEKIKATSVLADTHYCDLWWHTGIQPESRLREWQAATGMRGFFSWQQPQKVVYPPGGPLEIQSERFFTDYWPKDDPNKTPRALANSLIAQMKDVSRPWFTVIYDLDPNFAEETMKLLPQDQFKAVLMDEFFIAAEKAKEKVEGRSVKPPEE
jgi:hypothetical protein